MTAIVAGWLQRVFAGEATASRQVAYGRHYCAQRTRAGLACIHDHRRLIHILVRLVRNILRLRVRVEDVSCTVLILAHAAMPRWQRGAVCPDS
jgi:hypothetical protein